jgi:hypothetical protein
MHALAGHGRLFEVAWGILLLLLVAAVLTRIDRKR